MLNASLHALPAPYTSYFLNQSCHECRSVNTH